MRVMGISRPIDIRPERRMLEPPQTVRHPALVRILITGAAMAGPAHPA
jgi:hypothetical protein